MADSRAYEQAVHDFASYATRENKTLKEIMWDVQYEMAQQLREQATELHRQAERMEKNSAT